MNNDWGEAYDALCDRVEEHMKKEGFEDTYVIFSAWDDDENGNPTDNLDSSAFEGKGRITYQDHWGDASYTSHEMDSPTWLDICVETEKAIRISGDHHHIFLEGLDKNKEGLYELCMGS